MRKDASGGLALAFFILGVVILSSMCSGCYLAHAEVPPELVQCEVADCYLWRSEPGRERPQGRVDACEACSTTEAEIQARQVELGCRVTSAHSGCTLSGACSWADLLAHWGVIRQAGTCEELEDLAQADPCVRPDLELYWTQGCGGN